MIDVLKANPPEKTHGTGHYKIPTVSNKDIFRVLANGGVSVGNLNLAILNLLPGKTCQVGSIDKLPIYINHDGKFQVGYSASGAEAPAPVKVEDPSCKHTGWVAREIHGDTRFVCRECDERFPRHPQMMPPEPEEFIIPYDVLKSMAEFRQGTATFAQACKDTALSAEQFKDAIKKAFPPVDTYEEIATIGSLVTQRVVTGREPQRSSDPEEIEKVFFATHGLSSEDLLQSWREGWPDVEHVDLYPFENSIDRKTVVIVTFNDNTKQRFEFTEKEIMREAKSRSCPTQFIQPIIRQNYRQARLDDLISKEAL